MKRDLETKLYDWSAGIAGDGPKPRRFSSKRLGGVLVNWH